MQRLRKIPALVTMLMVTLMVSTSVAAELPDIEGHWAEADIRELVTLGAITGYPDGSYRPQNHITRAEFSSVLRGALGLSEVPGQTYGDTIGHWAEGRIEALIQAGVIDTTLYGPHYGPDSAITREEIAMMTVGILSEITGGNEIPFTDQNEVSTGFEPYVAEAFAQGIIRGYPDDTFRPKGMATRAEAAVMAIRALRIVGIAEDPFAIVFFAADKSSMTEGTSATLSWEVTGASSISISPDIGPVKRSGSRKVAPESTTIYMLVCTHPSGTTTATVTIVVEPVKIMKPGPGRGVDTYVWSHRSTFNMSSSNQVLVGRTAADGVRRSMLSFQTTDIPNNAVILSAELLLHQAQTYYTVGDVLISVHGVTGAWSVDTVTWDNQPTFDPTPVSANTAKGGQSRWVSWDVRDLVQTWVDGRVKSYGLLLKAVDEESGATVHGFFASEYTGDPTKRPELRIHYYVP